MFKTKAKGRDWLQFSFGYLSISAVACEELIETGDEFRAQELYIPIVFNLKHGLESFIKSALIIIEEKDLDDSNKNHNSLKVFQNLLNVLKNKKTLEKIKRESDNFESDEIFISDKAVQEFPEKLILLEELIHTYYYCDFFKEKIGENFYIEDSDNTVFRYPQNSMKIHLDYDKILSHVSISDINEIYADILKLQDALTTFWIIFESYLQVEAESEIKSVQH